MRPRPFSRGNGPPPGQRVFCFRGGFNEAATFPVAEMRTPDCQGKGLYDQRFNEAATFQSRK